jgi:hypothetical protein
MSLPFYFKIAIFIGCLVPLYYYYYQKERSLAKPISTIKWKSGMIVMTMLNYIDLLDIFSSCRLIGLHYLHTLVVTTGEDGKLYGVELNFGMGRLEVRNGKVLDIDNESPVYGYSYPIEIILNTVKNIPKITLSASTNLPNTNPISPIPKN